MNGNGRILGLDYGTKTVGVAVSDPLFLTAQGVEIIRREKPTKLRRTLARIEELIAEYEVTSIVLGYPMHLNGDEGDRCQATKEFKEMLEKRTKLPVTLVDERLTTVEADDIMFESGITDRHERKKYVDKIAAMLILQDYLNEMSNKL
ncbi:MAG: Holliday junction resolvase RuvX [Lachnospiraceae bacterium]|nr:Holliday junction resolvase RuvX [Lachnospiraceae bacterium]